MENQENTSQPQKKMTWEEMYGKKKTKKKKNKVVIFIIAALVLVALVGAFALFKKLSKKAQTLKDNETVVEAYGEKDMTAYINATGVVESGEVSEIVTSLQYPVKEIKVQVGDHVKSGDVVCVIDDKDIDEKIEALEAQASDEDRRTAKEIEISKRQVDQARKSSNRNVSHASQEVADAKSEWDDAISEREDAEEAYNKAAKKAKKVIAKASNTDALAKNPKYIAFTTAEAELKAAQANEKEKEAAYKAATSAYDTAAEGGSESVQAAENSNELTLAGVGSYSAIATELANYYEMKENSVILADCDGIVTSISAVEGLPTSGSVMRIENDEKLQIKVSIKEKDILKMKEGMEVEISSSTLSEVTGKGKISKVLDFVSESTAPAAKMDMTGGAQSTAGSYTAVIDVEESENMLLGMNVKAKIATGREVTVLAVPYTAVMNDSQGEYVYVAQQASGLYVVVKKTVETGESGDYYTEITGGDLEPDDKVICYPESVTENSIVQIKE